MCVSASVCCVCVYAYIRATGNEADDKRYQRLLCYKRSIIKMAIFLKRPRLARETGNVVDQRRSATINYS